MAARPTHALTVGDYVMVHGIKDGTGKITMPEDDPDSVLWQIWRRCGRVVPSEQREIGPYDCLVLGLLADTTEPIACYWDELAPATEEDYAWQCLHDRLTK